MDLDLNQLRTFHAVARAHSYTRAARRLHVTQSAVSHAMRKLEDRVGQPLVLRRGRSFTLTPAGQELFESCERIFAELGRVEVRLSGEGGPRRRLVLGATVEFGTTVLIERLAPFVEAHPELHLDFRFSHHLVQPLLRDEVDLAVDCVPHPHPSVVSTDLFRETYKVIAAPSFLARNPVGGPADLAHLPLLSMDGEGAWWGRVLRALPVRPRLRRIVTLNHVRGIINATVAGLGVGLAPSYTVLAELEEGRLVELFPDLSLLEDRFRIVCKHSRRHQPAIVALSEFLRAMDLGAIGGAIPPVA